jgi:class 3 adenylate cyclase
MCGAPLSTAPRRRERRRVTVVFFDLAGFSALTRDFDPEALRDLADDVLTVVAGIVEAHDGFVDAFQGDGLIALFGAPHSHPNDPERAVLAAAEGLRAVEEIGRAKGYPLRGRAGVNTGLVIAGELGAGRIKGYTVMGSAVNLAARLEAAATPGEVWVGPETYRATRHALRFVPSPLLNLQGFPDVTQAYRFVAEARQRDPYAHLPFVGRETERAKLWSALERATKAGVLLELWLVGEAGSGKTRLAREFARDVERAQRAQVVWLDAPAVIPSDAPSAPDMRPPEDLWAESEHPWLVVVDTPHHAAWPHLEALRRTATRGLMLHLARQRPLEKGGAHDVLTLPPLATDDCLRILAELVEPNLGLVTRSLVHETGGNPAYTIELGRTLSNARTGAFSGSLSLLLQARLDMLAPTQRHLLARLALVGERVWLGLAQRLAGNRADLDALLAEDVLIREEVSSLPGETELRFRSELLRRAALLMVPLSDRPALHLQVARWLAPRAGSELRELVEHHLSEAKHHAPA